jgi:uncharacterized membrane protein
MILCCNTVVVLLRAIELMILCCNSVVVLLRAIELMILCCSTHYKVKKFWTDQFFVLDILNRVWTLLNILSIDWTCTEQILIITEHYSKFWTDSEHSEHRLNRFWTLLNITEHSEQIHFSLNFSFSLLNQYILLHFH